MSVTSAGRQWATEFVPLFRGILLALPVALLAGSASALFLKALDWATAMQWQRPQLLWALPAGGLLVGLLYHFWGRGSDKGNNLILEEIHAPGGGVPGRMAPLVLFGTLVSHLFGGSAGREGTAVQMGGSLASLLSRVCRLGPAARRMMLMCGVSAGFGSVFGTPLAGAVFAMEVLVVGRVQYEALVPVLVASIVGDATCSAWGVHHTIYHLDVAPGAGSHAAFQAVLLVKVAGSAICFGLASRLFSEVTHGLQRCFARLLPFAPLRPVLGGLLVIGLVLLTGTRDFLGLGVHAPPGGAVSILSSFEPGGASGWSWLGKLLFTSVTLGSGFKGGEVTPLFYVGATLGNAIGALLQEPVGLFAALGFIAVFAGAANTPLACTLMGIELFGAHYAVYFAVACFVAFMASGHSGIYLSQRVAVGKGTIQDGSGEGDVTLRDWYKRAIQDEEPPPPKS